MLQNGKPGHTLLIESGDLRDVDASSSDEGCCCLIYDSLSNDSTPHAFNSHIPYTVDHVVLYSNSVSLPKAILQLCSELTSVDLSPLSQVTEVRDCFLGGCSGLTSLELTPLIQVNRGFLWGCTGLTSIDLGPLSQLTQVHDFMKGCTGLTTLDLSPLSQVTIIESGFLQGCTGLTELDLSPFSQVTTIEMFFLADCSGLSRLDLSPLSKLTKVLVGLLRGCTITIDGPSQLCDAPHGWWRVADQWVRDQ
eukprot:TRINITY_DN16938_c0_g2_i1.p1 TRINITY_DN16938_c0_g2~~TRINITY_DN16938_c0_g2_i1.p1  ORF type:complete len:250 (-),score=6.35 TRINITY_DN16938_c0_g2_i1:208-957(-)